MEFFQPDRSKDTFMWEKSALKGEVVGDKPSAKTMLAGIVAIIEEHYREVGLEQKLLMCLNEMYARLLVKQFPKTASIPGACHDWSPQGVGMSQREADHRVCFWHLCILLAQPHTSVTLGCHMDGASL